MPSPDPYVGGRMGLHHTPQDLSHTQGPAAAWHKTGSEEMLVQQGNKRTMWWGTYHPALPSPQYVCDPDQPEIIKGATDSYG